MTTWAEKEEWLCLDAEARKRLQELAVESLPYNAGRALPLDYRALVIKGLAFRSHCHITITDKGRELAERC
jgi:hypothetical protein